MNSEFNQTTLYRYLHQLFGASASVPPILLAYSGGLDSHVLLHALVSLRALIPDLMLRVIHINHGLSANSKAWAQHCQQVSQALGVACVVKNVAVKRYSENKNVEEVARNLRYQACVTTLMPNEYLMTAHTQDDQAETLLLQLLRGAGLKGLAAMPVLKNIGATLLVRPLLGTARQALLNYADIHHLNWVEDESNGSLKYDRNYLRHEILPLLRQRWPATTQVLQRTAQHLAETSTLLDELAAHDLQAAAGSVPGTLSCIFLTALTSARKKNLLRYWLRKKNLRALSTCKLAQFDKMLLASRPDANPVLRWQSGEIRRFKGDVYVLPLLSNHHKTAKIYWDITQPLVLPENLGLLTLQQIAAVELQAVWIAIPEAAEISVRFRQGGERFHPAQRVGSHPLKKLLQEWHVPPWLRDRIPLIYHQEQLIAVAGYAVAKNYMPSSHRRGKALLLESFPGSITY